MAIHPSRDFNNKERAKVGRAHMHKTDIRILLTPNFKLCSRVNGGRHDLKKCHCIVICSEQARIAVHNLLC